MNNVDLAAAEAGIYATALLRIERELDQYRGAKALRQAVRWAVTEARREVADLVAPDRTVRAAQIQDVSVPLCPRCGDPVTSGCYPASGICALSDDES